uniref:Uncharacterized protein n=1 Tax=Nelumbo nucifera TaxID=4432 RepID=A0A822ZYU2_NELNU|nr:TPA_asm: hypothetical protein HUJ06_018638 [Nelumbo nucifera]
MLKRLDNLLIIEIAGFEVFDDYHFVPNNPFIIELYCSYLDQRETERDA